VLREIAVSEIPGVLPVAGLRLAAVAAGIRYQGRKDLVLLELPPGASCAAVFTRNAFCAAPVLLARAHLAQTDPRFLLINSGNANAGTGEQGMQAARHSCRLLADLAGCAPDEVLPFSTGVIGEPLPLEPFASAMPGLLDALDTDNWEAAARAIMTTDTRPKLVSRQLKLADTAITITGMAKGSGMIRPDMATMLAYVATDVRMDKALLQTCLQQAVAPSFNAISVDGDTSTNDACVLLATGASGVVLDGRDQAGVEAFLQSLTEVCMALARDIVLDGEGASKLMSIRVSEAQSVEEAREVAYTVAHSPLVKTAFFASDPNWGRILAAVGRSGIAALDVARVSIRLGDVTIVSQGGRDPGYREAAGQAVMRQAEIPVHISLGRGDAEATVLTCDLSFDYVRINAEYRT
jgi:glutamate N-acetyltransferase/amino-acid N-acetyltransferase